VTVPQRGPRTEPMVRIGSGGAKSPEAESFLALGHPKEEQICQSHPIYLSLNCCANVIFTSFLSAFSACAFDTVGWVAGRASGL